MRIQFGTDNTIPDPVLMIFAPMYSNSVGQYFFIPAQSWVVNSSLPISVRARTLAGQVVAGPPAPGMIELSVAGSWFQEKREKRMTESSVTGPGDGRHTGRLPLSPLPHPPPLPLFTHTQVSLGHMQFTSFSNWTIGVYNSRTLRAANKSYTISIYQPTSTDTQQFSIFMNKLQVGIIVAVAGACF